MAGLDDLNPASPAGNALLSGGDDAIRLIVTKLIEFAAVEHANTGEHTFGVGTIAARPAANHAGRIYILTVAGVAAELQYDTGSAWVTITTNQAVINYADALATHISAATLDHPNNSVTAAKIAAGAILKKHLMGGVSTASIAALVNGGLADALHSHTWNAQEGITGFTEYTVPGSHIITVPDGVVRMYFTLIPGGGAGSPGFYSSPGAGGCPGPVVWNYPLTVTPEEELDIYIGQGGSATNDWNAPAADGESTTVERLPYEAFGGKGGFQGVGGAQQIGMLPPAGPGGDANKDGASTAWFSGGVGGLPGGGGGSASMFGAGKNGGATDVDGADGSDGSGVGGGGGGNTLGGGSTYGGNGGSGRLLVTW